MVILVSEKAEQQIAARQQATRSGAELVPAVVRDAGQQAVESYLCFFAKQRRTTASSYRSAVHHFCRWCGDSKVSLQGVRAGHVETYLQGMAAIWKPNTLLTNFYAIKNLFAHLECDRIIERTPFIGLDAPKVPKPAAHNEQTPYEVVCQAFCEQWGYDGNEVTQAAMVMIAPACIASFDVNAIQAWSKLPLPTVESIISRLYEKGIWFEDKSIRCEWLDPECDGQDFAMLMDAFVVVGRFDRDEEMRYSLPKERYEEIARTGDN